MTEIPKVPGPEAGKINIPGMDDFERRRNETMERIYSDRERGGGVPMEGQQYYNLLKKAEIGENGETDKLMEVLEKVRAYQEGLYDSSSSFLIDFDPDKPNDIHTRRAMSYFRDLFLTVEGASNRPNAPYVSIQEKLAIEVPLTEAEWWRNDPEKYRNLRIEEFNEINEARMIEGKEPISSETIQNIINQDEMRLTNEYLALDKLLGISNYVEAREALDFAFRQRMATCENPDSASKLGGEIRAVSPDSSTWESFFHTEGFSDYGERVDSILEEIIKFGLPDSKVRSLGLEPIPVEVRRKVNRSDTVGAVYADGFKDATSFGHWLKYLINKADGRVDVVWSAWRLALTWEVPEQLGIYIDSTGKNKYVLSAPPVGNALMSQTIHTKEKRKHEFGWTSEDKRYQLEKFVSHSGLPLTFEVFPKLCEDFLHQTKVEFGQDYLDLEGEYKNKIIETLTNIKNRLPSDENDVDFNSRRTIRLKEDLTKFLSRTKKSDRKYEVQSVKVSLWELRMYGGLKFSDKYFPWLVSDQPSNVTAEAGELPSGAFGFWLLTRSRAATVYLDVKSIISAKDLSDPSFFVSRLRTWSKVMGTIKDVPSGNKDYVPPSDNPRAVWLLAHILYYNPGESGRATKIAKANPEVGFRTSSKNNRIENKIAGSEERGISWGDILFNAQECGFIREEDRKWILDKASIILIR